MAIYHLHASVISRSTGRSAVAASAYIASSVLHDNRQNITHDYSRKSNVYTTAILAPANSPEWALKSETLWNRAEQFEDELANLRYRGFDNEAKNVKSMLAKEKQINSAQTAATLEGSLPLELNKKVCKELVEEFLKSRFVSRDLVVEYAIHWESGNPHFHAIITRRPIVGDDFLSVKDRDIVSREALKETRKLFADVANKYLELSGFEARIDHRSYKDMGLTIEPSNHKGWKASNLELVGEYSRISKENEKIRNSNIEILFHDPSQIIKEVALKHTVFTQETIANEIVKRVGGDHVLFEILQEKVNHISIPNEVKQDANNASSNVDSGNAANDNKVFYEGIRNLEEQGKYYNLLAENAAIYAEDILIEQDEAVLVGTNMRNKTIYASKNTIEQENRIFELADKVNISSKQKIDLDSTRIDYFISKNESESAFTLNEQQRVAIHYLCTGSNIRTLIGRAGTGKTTLLKVVADGYKDAGYRVVGTSFQGKTVELMAKEIGIKTNTLDSYRIAWQEYDSMKAKIDNNELSGKALNYAVNQVHKLQSKLFDDKTVVIVDEANMVGKHLWEPLIAQVERSGAKLIIVQDPAQIKAHTAGDIARGLLDRYGAYKLTHILRQKVKWQRECSGLLNEHNLVDGLKPYLNKGNISWHHEQDQCYKQIVEDYVSGIKGKSDNFHLFMSFLNNKVNSVNIRIHECLKLKGYLKEHCLVGGKEYSINERIVFTDRNENIGNKVKTINDHPGKGVKNGTFGTIIAINQNENRNKTSFTVKLDDERIVKFNPQEYSHFSYGYGITINKAEGLTCDYSYVLFDPKMNANLTLIAMTRHKEDTKGYLLESEFVDFKDLTQKIGNSQKKELVSDYTITAQQKPYYDRIKDYKEATVAISQLMEQEPTTTQDFHKIKEKTCIRNNLAKEILAEYREHSLFVMQANIRKQAIEVHAGTRQRTLSDLEIKAQITVERYSDIATDTRNLWNEIKTTHPARMAKSHDKYKEYNDLREERDSLASVISESQKLYGQFLKSNNIRWQAIQSQTKAHFDRQLHNSFVNNLSQEEKANYNTVKSYIEARNNVISFVAHLRDKSNDQNSQNAQIYNFPQREEYQLFQQEKQTRDELALKIIENHEIYEKYRSVLKVNTNSLLEHAVKGEEYQLTQTQSKAIYTENSKTNETTNFELIKEEQKSWYNFKAEAKKSLSVIYADVDKAINGWNQLIEQEGIDTASKVVQTYPNYVADYKGTNILGIKSADRKIAEDNKNVAYTYLAQNLEADNKIRESQQTISKLEQEEVQNKENTNIDNVPTHEEIFDSIDGKYKDVYKKLGIYSFISEKQVMEAAQRYKEISINICEITGKIPSKLESDKLLERAVIEQYFYEQAVSKLDKQTDLDHNAYEIREEANRVAHIAGNTYYNGQVTDIKELDDKLDSVMQTYNRGERIANILESDKEFLADKPEAVANQYAELKVKFEERFGPNAHITNQRNEFFLMAAEHINDHINSTNLNNTLQILDKQHTTELNQYYKELLQDEGVSRLNKQDKAAFADLQSHDYKVFDYILVRDQISHLEIEHVYNQSLSRQMVTKMNYTIPQIEHRMEDFKYLAKENVEEFVHNHSQSITFNLRKGFDYGD